LITGLLAPNADERLKRETIEVMVERLNWSLKDLRKQEQLHLVSLEQVWTYS
jgi:hypothetical protein